MSEKKLSQKQSTTTVSETQQIQKHDPRSEVLKELVGIATQLALCDPEDVDELRELLPRLRRSLKKLIKLMGPTP